MFADVYYIIYNVYLCLFEKYTGRVCVCFLTYLSKLHVPAIRWIVLFRQFGLFSH